MDKMIEEGQVARVTFKGWPPHVQRQWLLGILDEFAYSCRTNGEEFDHKIPGTRILFTQIIAEVSEGSESLKDIAKEYDLDLNILKELFERLSRSTIVLAE